MTVRARLLPPCLLLATLAAPAAAAEGDGAPPDLAALVECRLDYPALLALLPVQADPLRAVSLGWRPQPQSNPFMVEYRLNTPIRVFGHATDHIALAGDAVLAVLDLPDPRPLARQLELEAGIDTPAKAMFGREVRAEEVPAAAGEGPWIESAVLTVSNVDSHPGKTLAGCAYSREPVEPEAAPAGDAASAGGPAPPSPAPALPR